MVAAHAQSTPEAASGASWTGSILAIWQRPPPSTRPPAPTSSTSLPPYTWNGPKAFDDWSAAFDANSKALGVTDPKVTLGAPVVRNVTSGQAYLTYPSLYTYKLKGVSMRKRDTSLSSFAKNPHRPGRSPVGPGPVLFPNQSNKIPAAPSRLHGWTALPPLCLRMFEESQVERCEHQDYADVDY